MIKRKSAKQPKTAATETHETDLELVSGGRLMVSQGFDYARIADGNEFCRGKTFQVGPHAHAADAEDRGDGPEQRRMEEGLRIAVRRLERGQDIEADIDKEKSEVPTGDKLDALVNDLVAVGQQVEERKQKIAKHQGHADKPPLADLALIEPEGFLGDIGVPDEKILGKPDVAPENGKRQHELADRMQMVRVQDALVVAAPIKPEHDQHAASKGAAHAVGKIVNAIHRGE